MSEELRLKMNEWIEEQSLVTEAQFDKLTRKKERIKVNKLSNDKLSKYAMMYPVSQLDEDIVLMAHELLTLRAKAVVTMPPVTESTDRMLIEQIIVTSLMKQLEIILDDEEGGS